jgi:deazaflavin-dependent oxidoreductase (nitroreductase family)
MMPDKPAKTPRLPPPWFIRTVWAIHRAVFRLTGGKLGLWRAKPDRWGTIQLTTIGRRTGKERVAILGYFEDGPNLVTLAMNGWMPDEPAWWLNLQDHPDATIELAGESRRVRARAAHGEERERLWELFRGPGDSLDALAKRRPSETDVVILEPRSATGSGPAPAHDSSPEA